MTLFSRRLDNAVSVISFSPNETSNDSLGANKDLGSSCGSEKGSRNWLETNNIPGSNPNLADTKLGPSEAQPEDCRRVQVRTEGEGGGCEGTPGRRRGPVGGEGVPGEGVRSGTLPNGARRMSSVSSEDSSTIKRRCNVNRQCTGFACAFVCTKVFLFIFNLAFLVGGWSIFGIGVWLHVFKETLSYGILLKDNVTQPMLVFNNIPIALIIVGCSMIIIGFLGCCGSCTESVCFLGFYSFFLILYIFGQIIGVLVITRLDDSIRRSILSSLQYQIRHEYNITARRSNDTDSLAYKTTIAWDRLHVRMNCCGAVGPKDFHNSAWFNNTLEQTGHFVPLSCCSHLSIHPALEDSPVQSSLVADNTHDRPGRVQQGKTQPDRGLNNLGKGPPDRGKPPKGEGEFVISDMGEISCQLGAIREPDEPMEGFLIKREGCYSAVRSYVMSTLPPIITLIVFLDILQIGNLVNACLLIKKVRQKHTDYSWCEGDDEFD